jgi:hypothetical protein
VSASWFLSSNASRDTRHAVAKVQLCCVVLQAGARQWSRQRQARHGAGAGVCDRRVAPGGPGQLSPPPTLGPACAVVRAEGPGSRSVPHRRVGTAAIPLCRTFSAAASKVMALAKRTAACSCHFFTWKKVLTAQRPCCTCGCRARAAPSTSANRFGRSTWAADALRWRRWIRVGKATVSDPQRPPGSSVRARPNR